MPDDPTKGLKYLYLTDADHAALSQAAGGPSYRAEALTAPDGVLQACAYTAVAVLKYGTHARAYVHLTLSGVGHPCCCCGMLKALKLSAVSFQHSMFTLMRPR